MQLKWIREADGLPRIGQEVLLATPRQAGEIWDISVAKVLARHEAVAALPIRAGERWPVDYWWSRTNSRNDTCLITGNGWWASLSEINLPPQAKHERQNGYDFVAQIGDVFVSMFGK